MIKLLGGYYMDADARCYSVGKLAKKPDKDGSPVLNAEAFCTTPTSAILWLKERLRREAVSKLDGDFDAFIEAIKKSDEKIVKLLKEVVG